MDSLIPAALAGAPLAGAAGLAFLVRLRVRSAMIWAAAAVLFVGLWIASTAMISRLPLMTYWAAWDTIAGQEVGTAWLLIGRFSWPLATALLTFAAAAVLTGLARLDTADPNDLVWAAVFCGPGLAACYAASLPAVMVAWTALDLAGVIYANRPRTDPGTLSAYPAGTTLGVISTIAILLALAASPGGQGDPAGIQLAGSPLVLLCAGTLRLIAATRSQADSGSEVPAALLLWKASSTAGALAVMVVAAGLGGIDRWAAAIVPAAALAALAWPLRRLLGQTAADHPGSWALSLGALVSASAAAGLPVAAASLAVALLLGGALNAIAGPGKPRYRWLFLLTAVLASGVPFSPSWGTAALIEGAAVPWGIVCAAAYAGCLAGLLSNDGGLRDEPALLVPGVRTIHIGGLVLIVAGLVIAGWAPILTRESDPAGWWGGGVVLLLTTGWLWFGDRLAVRRAGLIRTSFLEMAAAWVRRIWRRGAGGMVFALRLLARLLEGEAAILWALVLLSLIVSLFAQLGLGA